MRHSLGTVTLQTDTCLFCAIKYYLERIVRTETQLSSFTTVIMKGLSVYTNLISSQCTDLTQLIWVSIPQSINPFSTPHIHPTTSSATTAMVYRIQTQPSISHIKWPPRSYINSVNWNCAYISTDPFPAEIAAQDGEVKKEHQETPLYAWPEENMQPDECKKLSVKENWNHWGRNFVST